MQAQGLTNFGPGHAHAAGAEWTFWAFQTDSMEIWHGEGRQSSGGFTHGLKQRSPAWQSSLSSKLRLWFPSLAFPTCSPKLYSLLRPSGFALLPWGLWDLGACVFAEGFHLQGSWNQLLPWGTYNPSPCRASFPALLPSPLSARQTVCHLLCRGITVCCCPLIARATKQLSTPVQ